MEMRLASSTEVRPTGCLGRSGGRRCMEPFRTERSVMFFKLWYVLQAGHPVDSTTGFGSRETPSGSSR